MTNVDLSDIKIEPLSPEANQQILAAITLPASQNETPSPSPSPMMTRLGLDIPTPHFLGTAALALTSSSTAMSFHYNKMNTTTTTSSRQDFKEYTSINQSPMMSRGIAKAHENHHQQSFLCVPSESTTTSTAATMPTSTICNVLKSSIISKRKARGEVTPLNITDSGPREYKLTKREIERKEARKEQNRRAARRCRMKKKRIQLQAGQEMQNAIKENIEMKNEVQILRQQVNELQEIISQHEKNKHCSLIPFESSYKTHKEQSSNTQTLGILPDPIFTSPEADVKPLPPGPKAPSDAAAIQEILRTFPGNDHPDIKSPSDESLITSISNSSSNISPSSFTLPNSSSTPSKSTNFSHQLITNSANSIEWDLDQLTNIELPSEMMETILEDDNSLSYSEAENSPDFSRSDIRSTSTAGKPAVVRNLSKCFAQTDVHHRCQEMQNNVFNKADTPLSLIVPERSSFSNVPVLQTSQCIPRPDMSSPELSCVAPNLVQSIIPTSSIQSNDSIISSRNNFLFSPKTQNSNTFSHCYINNELFHSESRGNDDNNALQFSDMEPPRQQSTAATAAMLPLPYPVMSSILSDNTGVLTDLHIETSIPSTTTTTNGMLDSLGAAYIHQFSPISTPSPSSTSSTIASPEYILQISPLDPCYNKSDLDSSYNNSVSIFEF